MKGDPLTPGGCRLDGAGDRVAPIAGVPSVAGQDEQTFMRTSAGVFAEGAVLAEGARLGAWAIEGPVAAGGMGQVYRARRADGVYDHAVAIKLIHDRDPVRVERFAAERQRLAAMDHPGIARIIDGGTHSDGRPWMAMELVEGLPLMPQAADLPLARRLRLFIDLCSAVGHAHGRLVLHRDLKSANVLLDSAGQVRLIDFGISALAEGDVKAGASYTPATAAPEQMRGEAPTVRTDIFALGCMLHELLTGEVPKRADRSAANLHRGMAVHEDLQAIMARATAFEPDDRYPSAEALADDVQAFLGHRPVVARQGGRVYRAGKFLRRFPLASGLAMAFVAALVGGIVVSLTYARQAEAQALRAQGELERAEYFLQRNNTVNHAREAYADALQTMFASDADTERMTRLLKERWAEAHGNRQANPLQAAALSYSIGRHFVYRNDYTTALTILEPWLAAGYGPKELLDQGRVVVAYAYLNTGKREQAEALFRQNLLSIEKGYEAYSPDHASAASDLATLTRDTADLAMAEAVLVKVAASPDHPPDIASYLWNQTGLVRLMQGNRPGALEAWRRAVAIIEDNPLASPSGRDTRRVNLAYAEFHMGGSEQAAEALVAKVLGQDLSETGLNREIGRALGLRGEIALSRGRLEPAIADLERAAAIIERFSGTRTGHWALEQSALVEALVAAGRLAEAKRAQTALEVRTADGGPQTITAAISRAMLLAGEGRTAEARVLLDGLSADADKLARSAHLPTRMARARARLAAGASADSG